MRTAPPKLVLLLLMKLIFINVILLFPLILNILPALLASIVTLPIPFIVRFLLLKVISLFLSVVLLYFPSLRMIVLSTSVLLFTVFIAVLIPPESSGLSVISTALADDKQMKNNANNIVEIIIFLTNLSLFLIFSPPSPFYIFYNSKKTNVCSLMNFNVILYFT